MKRILDLLLTSFIILISFFYTNNLIKVSRKNDPIMLEIEEYKKENEIKALEAILTENEIIPGISGKTIDIDQSYKKMKKIGKFDKNLIVFKEAPPNETINKSYDKNIVSGNKKNNKISLNFEVNDTSYIEELLDELNKKETLATFFINKKIFDESIDVIKLIRSFGHDVELISNGYTIYEVNKYNSLLKTISNDNLSFCLNKQNEDKILKNCENSKMHSIIPSVVIENYIYNTIKHNLENGMITLVPINKQTIKELSATINYIKQKGKKIVLLSNLIQE